MGIQEGGCDDLPFVGIAPPGARGATAADQGLTQAWLRDAGLNRERILLLQPRGAQSAQQLTCEALRLGRSHTVV